MFPHRSHARVRSKEENEITTQPAKMATGNVRYARYVLFAVFVCQPTTIWLDFLY